MDGKEQQYNLIISSEYGMPMNMFTRTDEDLIEKFLRCREDKFSYFQWNKGCIPMRNLLGVMFQ